MRILCVWLAALVLSGCGNDLCDGIAGACVDLTVNGSGQIDTLKIRASSIGFDETRLAPPWATPASLPVYLALALDPQTNGLAKLGGGGFPGGALRLDITGLAHNQTIGVAQTSLTLGANDHVSASVRLGAAMTPVEDLASAPDLASPSDLTVGCVDTTNDPRNCGQCGHDCLGGGCKSSQCQPMLLAVNTNQQPFGIAVDATNVYWSSTGFQGGVWKLPLAGGTATAVWSDSNKSFGLMALNNGMLYSAVTASGVWAVATSGGTGFLVESDTRVNSVAADSGHLYWGSNSSILAISFPSDMGLATAFSTCSGTCTGLASDGTVLLSNGTLGLQQFSLPSGPSSSVSSGFAGIGVAIDANHYYLADGSEIMAFDRSTSNQQILASGSNVRGVAVDSQAIYFTDSSTGSILRVRKPIGF
jgi:hypothetical protein